MQACGTGRRSAALLYHTPSHHHTSTDSCQEADIYQCWMHPLARQALVSGQPCRALVMLVASQAAGSLASQVGWECTLHIRHEPLQQDQQPWPPTQLRQLHGLLQPLLPLLPAVTQAGSTVLVTCPCWPHTGRQYLTTLVAAQQCLTGLSARQCPEQEVHSGSCTMQAGSSCTGSTQHMRACRH